MEKFNQQGQTPCGKQTLGPHKEQDPRLKKPSQPRDPPHPVKTKKNRRNPLNHSNPFAELKLQSFLSKMQEIDSLAPSFLRRGGDADRHRMECLLTELLAFLRDGEVSNYSTDSYRLNRDKSVAVSNTAKMSKDLSTCPRGVKVLLLGSGGVLVIGQYSGESFWESWCPLPSRAD